MRRYGGSRVAVALAARPAATQHRFDSAPSLGGSFPRWSQPIYGDHVAEQTDAPDAETEWMAYLREIQSREGWSIARVARESGGKIHKATLFRMMTGKTKRVPVHVVRLVAVTVGDDPEAVLRRVDEIDPRLEGLD